MQKIRPQLILSPSLSAPSNQDLNLESTLAELPLHNFSIDITCLGIDLAGIFEKNPLLPGAILVDKEQFVGMISRRILLEYLLRPHGLELFLNNPLEVLFSYAQTEILILNDHTPILAAAQRTFRRSPSWRGEPILVKDNSAHYQLLDVQELNIAYWQIRGIETQVRYERNQLQMIQTEKMASLGRLVDGVAHEILDPLGFIWGNLTYVSTYTEQLMELVSAYEAHIPQLPSTIIELKEDIELDYLQTDLPRAIASIRTGAERLKKLVTGLQNFCHIDEVYPKPADLHSALDGIILLLKSRLSSEIEIIKNYGNLPPVQCFIGQLNQVFINILTKAIDALISDAVEQKFSKEYNYLVDKEVIEKPRITITTEVRMGQNIYEQSADSRWVSICIADNGLGMKDEVKKQILASFSTVNRAVKETNLAVSYQIITAKHGGEFHLRSQWGIGTEFEILLPLV